MLPTAYAYKDCYVKVDKNTLVIGNDWIERRWSVSGDIPISVSLLNKADGTEWLDPDADARGQLHSCRIPGCGEERPRTMEVEFGTDDDFGIGVEHLKVTVRCMWSDRQLKLEYVIYPGTGWIRQTASVRHGSGTEGVLHPAETNQAGSRVPAAETSAGMDQNALLTHAGRSEDYLDSLPLASFHLHWQAVELRDVTDTNNNLISFEEGLLYTNDVRKLRGNVLMLRQSLQPTGLIIVKEGPTPHGHLQDPGGDFEFNRRRLRVTGSGIGPEDWSQDEWIPTYGSAVGVYGGSEYDALRHLDGLYRSIRRPKPERDFFLMCNNWGDRSKDGRVSESFVLGELRRAAELGVTNVQIDDGWQHGNTTNSVNPAGGRWSDYYADGDGFWNIHPERFPNGFEPLVEAAERYGVRLALWFSPDSAHDFVNWHKDADRLLELHRRYRVCYFKLDGIKIRSKHGENRLVRMMQTVVQAANGRVYFNLDTTNEIRLGYFGRTQYGGLFLENRYTDFRSYYPHWTLRNLWLLSKYVPAHKLQMEVLNVDRNRHVYGDDPLSPYRCGIAYAFAVTMFSNPLIWMELTGLSEENIGILKQALRVYNEHQHHILSGHVLPIGDTPDGTSWTGFQSITGETEGYLLVLRELHPDPSASIPLWGLQAGRSGDWRLSLRPLLLMEDRNQLVEFGDSPQSIEVTLEAGKAGASISVSLRNPFSFGLYHYKVLQGDSVS